MKKKELISQIFKILLLYEDAIAQQDGMTKENYIGYLDRLYVFWLGVGYSDIYNILKGLKTLELNAEHKVVKSLVFHIINLIERGGNYGV
jgi:hypothetical protein